jgi:hypothetical protein
MGVTLTFSKTRRQQPAPQAEIVDLASEQPRAVVPTNIRAEAKGALLVADDVGIIIASQQDGAKRRPMTGSANQSSIPRQGKLAFFVANAPGKKLALGKAATTIKAIIDRGRPRGRYPTRNDG